MTFSLCVIKETCIGTNMIMHGLGTNVNLASISLFTAWCVFHTCSHVRVKGKCNCLSNFSSKSHLVEQISNPIAYLKICSLLYSTWTTTNPMHAIISSFDNIINSPCIISNKQYKLFAHINQFLHWIYLQDNAKLSQLQLILS